MEIFRVFCNNEQEYISIYVKEGRKRVATANSCEYLKKI